jgi:hypothetical protein
MEITTGLTNIKLTLEDIKNIIREHFIRDEHAIYVLGNKVTVGDIKFNVMDYNGDAYLRNVDCVGKHSLDMAMPKPIYKTPEEIWEQNKLFHCTGTEGNSIDGCQFTNNKSNTNLVNESDVQAESSTTT